MTNIYMVDNIKGGEKININVVGSVSNQEDMAEIETVAKVFIIAERMIDLTYDLKPEKKVSDSHLNSPKKSQDNRNSYNTSISLSAVRGLN